MLRHVRLFGLFCLLAALAGCGGGGDSVFLPIQPATPPTGVVATLAGSAGIAGTADSPTGPGSLARFRQPFGVTSDGTNVYVADTNNSTIRKIVIATGFVTTLAGYPGVSSFRDGSGTAAATAAFFNHPDGITTDGTNLYVADTGNNAIRQIVIATGVVTTLAGTPPPAIAGSTDGTGDIATFTSPKGIAIDKTNSILYVAQGDPTTGNNSNIRKIVIGATAATTVVSTLAGTGTVGSANGTGLTASFNKPAGITFDGTSTLYVADAGNNTIRKIAIGATAATTTVTTLAGSPPPASAGSADGTGTASFSNPTGITIKGPNLYVADSSNNTIRTIVIATGAVSTLAGSPPPAPGGFANGTGSAAIFNQPTGITTDGTNLYVADFANDIIRAISILN